MLAKLFGPLFDVRTHLAVVAGVVAMWAAVQSDAPAISDNGLNAVLVSPPLGIADGHDPDACGCRGY